MKFQTLAFILISISVICAQDTYNWKNHTDMKNITAVQAAGNGLWAASTGGGFFFDVNKNEYLTLHKNDGLIGTSLKAIAIDNDGKIWFGGNGGSLDVYDTTTRQIKTILDIYNDKEQSNKTFHR